MTLPDMDPMPPRTTIRRISYVMVEVKVLACTWFINMASSAPPMPAKKLLMIKLMRLCLARFMPMASAATSSSRMALKARP